MSTALHSPNVWKRFADDAYAILKRTHLENVSHQIDNLHQNINFTMEGDNKWRTSVSWFFTEMKNGRPLYWKPTHIEQYLHHSSRNQTSCKEIVSLI